MNINTLKIMFECYYCINSLKHSPKFAKNMAHTISVAIWHIALNHIVLATLKTYVSTSNERNNCEWTNFHSTGINGRNSS